MKRLLLSAAAASLLLTPLACDFQKTGNQLFAQKVMVGTLLSTPDVDVSVNALAGYDAGTLPDGGIPEGERITLPGQTAALVFFGTRTSDTGAPMPLADAKIRIEPQNGTAVSLENEGLGTYGKKSDFKDDGGVRYQSGANYRFVAEQGGETHVGLVEAAPAQERIEALHPATGVVHQASGVGLGLKRPPVAGGQERTLGFVTVIPISARGDKGQPTYTNFPTDPIGLIQLVATPFEYQKDTLDVPGTAFPARDSSYLVIFQTVRSGGPESANLFLGSALLVGTADVGLVHTPP